MKIIPGSIGRALMVPILRRVSGLAGRRFPAGAHQLENLMVLNGRILAEQRRARAPLCSLHEAEFKVFSQYGEDGILDYLINATGITCDEQVFVEFGVRDYLESNTRFLLQGSNWRGLVIDGSETCVDVLRHSDLYWRHDLTAVAAWIDRDNINGIIGGAGFTGRIGILSIDIDGNDYWVWQGIDVVDPVIVVVEWNSVLGPRHAVSIPYDPVFQRGVAHWSNLYWGASVAAFDYLAHQRGYALVGSNSAGNNLFFVRRDRLGGLRRLTAEEAYVESRFRDSRDEKGRLTFLGGAARRPLIEDLPLVEVRSGQRTSLQMLDAQTPEVPA